MFNIKKNHSDDSCKTEKHFQFSVFISQIIVQLNAEAILIDE